MLTLGQVAAATGARSRGLFDPDRRVSGVAVDSRRVSAGSLFVALRGQKHDGHDFVARALAGGAVAALVQRVPEDCSWAVEEGRDGPPLLVVEDALKALHDLAAYWRSTQRCRVVGVTGSIGKTTTKEMIASVLGRRYKVLKSEANLNTEIGLPLALLELRLEHQRAVLEMGMYGSGDIRLLAGLARPSVGVVTNVEPSHLERLGTLERIARAKAELVEALPADGVAVLNYDDPRVRAMTALTHARPFLFGLDPAADVWAEHVLSEGLEGVSFTLGTDGRRARVRMPVLGSHSVHAALAAAAVALNDGMSLEEAAEGLHRASPGLRLVVTPGVHGSTIVDDTYNANPASMLAALNLLSELGGRKIAVLGDMLELGPYEEIGHRKVARRAVDIADILVTVGPRGAIMAEEAFRCGAPPSRVHAASNNQEAAVFLEQILRPGDNVLIKGSRGMRMEEIVAGVSVSAD